MPQWEEHGYVESDGENYYYWKARKLWKLSENMPVEHISLDSFDWENDNFQCNSLSQPPLWRDIGDHAKRILAADLQYPIVISANGDIMDGDAPGLKVLCFWASYCESGAIYRKSSSRPDCTDSGGRLVHFTDACFV